MRSTFTKDPFYRPYEKFVWLAELGKELFNFLQMTFILTLEAIAKQSVLRLCLQVKIDPRLVSIPIEIHTINSKRNMRPLDKWI